MAYPAAAIVMRPASPEQSIATSTKTSNQDREHSKASKKQRIPRP
jgi:hypothetical protein